MNSNWVNEILEISIDAENDQDKENQLKRREKSTIQKNKIKMPVQFIIITLLLRPLTINQLVILLR